jgi:hypothetical protein
MKFVLVSLSFLATIVGFLILGNAGSAIHEIEAFIVFLIAAVLFSGGAIVWTIDAHEQRRLARGAWPAVAHRDDHDDEDEQEDYERDEEMRRRKRRRLRESD